MRRQPILVAFILIGAAGGASAQSPNRLHGTIAGIEAETIEIQTADGGTRSLPIAANARIAFERRLALADIKPGDYVGVEAQRQSDGSLIAEYINVFPASSRGTGEGQHPGSSGPQSSMTNANVDQIVVANTGNTLKLSYNGGTADIVIRPDTPILTPMPGDRSLLVVGKQVVAFVRPDAAGKPAVAALTVEKDGVAPP